MERISLQMIKSEWRYIGKNRLILISVLAIMFIPFMYSIFFLKSVWNPYGSTSHLPVAVVNQDQAVQYQGKTLNVGDQTIANLKKNHQLGWRFVSAKQAKAGLANQKYYSIISIPKDFSANAATLLDDTPKPMQLTYKTNGSANYIAEVMSQVAATKLNDQIKANVTEAYASAVFDQIYKVGKGMDTAAKGATKLKDGSVTLSDGLNTYTTGVAKVNNGLMTMKTSVGPLATGVQKLTDGANKLSAGINQYSAGVSKVNAGTQKLNGSTGVLASGVTKLSKGAKKLNNGLYTYTHGVYQLNQGMTTLGNGVSPLQSGFKKLYTGSQTLTAGLKTLNDNSGQLNTLLDQLNQQLSPLSTAAGQKQLETLDNILTILKSDQFNQNKDQYIQIMNALIKLQGMKNQLTGQASAVEKANKTAVADAQTVQAEQQKAAKQVPSSTNRINSLAQQIQAKKDDPDKVNELAGQISDQSKDLNQQASSIKKAAAVKKYAASAKRATNLWQGLQLLLNNMDSVITLLNADVDPTTDGTAQLLQYVGQLNVSQSQLAQLQSALSQAKNAGSMISSLQKYVGGVQSAYQGSKKLTSGMSQVNEKLPVLVSGIGKIQSGVTRLKTNSPKLLSGSQQLAGGLTTLNGKVPTLVSGVATLANGTAKLNSKSSQLKDGANRLASGTNQLNQKVPTLTSGVNKLAGGTGRLVNNSAKLNAGANKIKNGNAKLGSSLQKGADQVNGLQFTSKTAKMFAQPSELKHANYSVVPNYGHALAPYVLSLALYVGALVFNFAFPIRKVAKLGESATSWYLSKISVGAVEALAMALIEPTLMMVGGLSVDHVGSFYLISILFAEASMFIVMFLSMLLDNPGRFLAMVLLMLQLGGSAGTFPMEVTNHFYNVIHPFLPMTYSILGFRQALTSGMAPGTVGHSALVLAGFALVNVLLLWPTMWLLQRMHLMGRSQLDDNQKLQEVEDPNTSAHS